jgi:predicted adenine nucleotide alpha hydrolase (AANH) superfamily ATPase
VGFVKWLLIALYAIIPSMKLLLHTCCAPCSIQCVEELGGENVKPDLFWYNPNIHPYTEYRARLDAIKAFADEKKLSLVTEEEYDLRSFIMETFPFIDSSGKNERCAVCYTMRLERTAQKAAESGYDAFSTTLLISPYQAHELIRQRGEEIAAKHNIKFVYRDFRPYFREGQNKARAAGYYMQKYCGCIYSEEERYK